jgi:hypothetical protein
METEGSLPCSQDPTTTPYLEPDESSPYHSILFLKNQFNAILQHTSGFSYYNYSRVLLNIAARNGSTTYDITYLVVV